jgi:hypothetical protein
LVCYKQKVAPVVVARNVMGIRSLVRVVIQVVIELGRHQATTATNVVGVARLGTGPGSVATSLSTKNMPMWLKMIWPHPCWLTSSGLQVLKF